MNEEEFDVARDKLVYRPDGETVAWGVDSYAGLPVFAGFDNVRVGERMGYRMPLLTGLGTFCGSGLCLVVADRDAVPPAPGSTEKDEVHNMECDDGQMHNVLVVTKNCDTSLRAFVWKFGQCPWRV